MSQPHDPGRDGQPDGAGPQRPAGPYPPPPSGWGPPGPTWGQQQPRPAQHPQPFPQPGYAPPGYAPPGYVPPGYAPGYGPPGHGRSGPYPGQQPWASSGGWPPAPAPAPRRRRRWPWVLGLVALAAVVAAVALPLALRSTDLDPVSVERDVAAQYQQLRGGDVQLRCATGMRVEVDRTYRCTGTTDDGAAVDITVTITGRDGAYTWSDGS